MTDAAWNLLIALYAAGHRPGHRVTLAVDMPTQALWELDSLQLLTLERLDDPRAPRGKTVRTPSGSERHILYLA